MDINNGDDLFTVVDNDALLQCNHDDMPVYIAPLKAVLTVGHYVFCSTISGKSFVAEIIRNHGTHLFVCPYLPLYSEDTKPYINNPLALPVAISHPTCHGIVELVKTGCIASISITSITGIAFIFLADDVTNYFINI
jgi:hypothetical protein